MNEIEVMRPQGEWYKILVDDCKTIVIERRFRASMEAIECWHEVGKRIVEDNDYKKFSKGNDSANKDLAKAIGVSRTTIYYAIQFAKKCPVLSSALDGFGKDVSWHKITTGLLVNDEKRLELPSTKYRVVYADPPWCYGDKLSGFGGAEDHYPSMTIEALCKLNISSISDEDAVLFLWVTSPLLDECWPVIKAWGFEYKTSIVWNKDAHNFGHYVSVRHELLLICTRGSCVPEISELYPSVITEKRSKTHSEKPECFRELIDKLYPSGKRIELFARKSVVGWDRYGNEV